MSRSERLQRRIELLAQLAGLLTQLVSAVGMIAEARGRRQRCQPSC